MDVILRVAQSKETKALMYELNWQQKVKCVVVL